MSQPDRRSLLIGACRKRQDQIRHKLAQVRQRLQITDGLDNERWAQVERDLLARYDQEEERVQRLLNESQESLDAPHSHEASGQSTASVEPVGRPEAGRAQLLALQQNYKRAQLLVAQKNEQIARLQKELEAQSAPPSVDAEQLAKEQTIAKLRQQNQTLSAQVVKLKAESIDEEELDELHRQNGALSNALAERDQLAAELRAEIARLQAPSPAHDEELEELHRQNAALSNELAHRDQAEAELRAEILRLQEQPPANEVELEDLQRQNEYLNQELSLRDQSEAQLRAELARLQAQGRVAAELREQNTALSEEVNQQTEALLRVQTEFEGRILELTRQNEALRADLELKTEVIGRVQFDLELKTGDFDRLTRDHQQRGQQMEDLQRQVDDLVREASRSTPNSNEAELQAEIADLRQQLAQIPPSNEAELQAEIADLRQQLAQIPPSNEAELQAEIADLRQQLAQAPQLRADDSEAQQLQTQLVEQQQEIQQLKDKLAIQSDKFQLELELLRSAHQTVASELAKLHEAPLGAAPSANRSGFLGGDAPAHESGYLGGPAAAEPVARPPMRPLTPSKPSGWLGSPDEEPWDGYVRPNYSKAGLPPGAAGAAKVAARSANLGLNSSTEETVKPAPSMTSLGDLPPLELDSAVPEEAPDWLADPVAVESDELPDWLTAEKPTE